MSVTKSMSATAAAYDTWFPTLRCRSRSRFRSRFRKIRVRTCRTYAVAAGGVYAAITQPAQEAGRRVSRANKWAELQARTNGRYGK